MNNILINLKDDNYIKLKKIIYKNNNLYYNINIIIKNIINNYNKKIILNVKRNNNIINISSIEESINKYKNLKLIIYIDKKISKIITPNLRKMGQLKLIFYKIIIYHLVFNIYKNIKII